MLKQRKNSFKDINVRQVQEHMFIDYFRQSQMKQYYLYLDMDEIYSRMGLCVDVDLLKSQYLSCSGNRNQKLVIFIPHQFQKVLTLNSFRILPRVINTMDVISFMYIHRSELSMDLWLQFKIFRIIQSLSYYQVV